MTSITRFSAVILLAGLLACGCIRSVRGSAPDGPGQPKHTNRLAKESSPYLLQHAHNPVDWFPWSEEAFAKARKENRPVFLSIGYAACHWCHVMERESFESEEIAKVLNDGFVAIKVDREERPDLDDLYMTAVQMTTGRGGWPMSVFLTPDAKPFFGGTYFPPADFKQLLTKVSEVWKSRRPEIDRSADRIAAALKEHSEAESKPADPSRALSADTIAQLRAEYDAANGGFGDKPKFPPHTSFPLLFYSYEKRADKQALQLALGTLDAMARGGIRDHLGGGFHRYSTDAKWLVPHFEKMLYDNALLARAYTDAFRITGKPLYKEAATETLDWALREMRGPEGGFYSTLDADSEGEEGKYYLWSQAEIMTALGPEDGKLFCQAYDVQPGGNFADSVSGKRTGRNILHLVLPLAEIARANPAAPAPLRRSRAILLRIREKRPRPGLDDKRLTAWNALMIGALAHAAIVFKEPRYQEAARTAYAFLQNRLIVGGRIQRTWRPRDRGGEGERRRGGDTSPTPNTPYPTLDTRHPTPGFLEDHAYLLDATLDMYEAERSPIYLGAAQEIAAQLIERFRDAKGGFFDTPSDHEKLLVRAKSVYDQAIPNANAVAARALLRLAQAAHNPYYRDLAVGTIKAFATPAAHAPRAAQTLVLASAMYIDSDPLARGGTRGSLAGPQVENPKPKIQNPKLLAVSANTEAVTAGHKSELLLTLTVKPGWHINGYRPLDRSLIPTRVDVETMGSIVVGEVIYPTARRIKLGFSKSPMLVYQGSVSIRVPITVPKTATPGAYPLTVRIRYQPCSDKVCQAPETVKIVVPVMVKRP